MNPGDFLAAYVRQYVTTLVSPELVEPVTEATGHTMAMILNDPYFVSQLRAVIQLQEENQWLRAQVTHLQTTLSASGSRTTSTPRKVSRTSTKASSANRTPSSSPKSRNVKVGGTSSRATKAAFIKGIRQAKR